MMTLTVGPREMGGSLANSLWNLALWDDRVTIA
jgi:hypothetical protein